jgi:hypothetical protein
MVILLTFTLGANIVKENTTLHTYKFGKVTGSPLRLLSRPDGFAHLRHSPLKTHED